MLAFPSVFAAVALFSAVAQAGKRGLVWPYYNSPLDVSTFKNSKGQVAAIYDYETYAPPSKSGVHGLNFIGMQRCLDCASSPINQLAARQKQQKWNTVFTLNEPDINGISPSQAASWYKQHINSLPTKKALPAITSSGSKNQGVDWLNQMIKSCGGGCKYDYINLHWYGKSYADFKNYVTDVHKKFPSKQIVITEFALQNPSGGQTAQYVFSSLPVADSESCIPYLPNLSLARTRRMSFYKEAFKFLDAQSFVHLYFPFVATKPSLFKANDAAGANFVGTGSCLFNENGRASPVGQLLL
ncbi:hypothetical protein GSI_08937 [Ganoderma sinense ZZ0214-1]|uniref:Asl1-like glycosyl hydrolase catalytic domain-containing protein n=1 Tax=Ganoderma sinense ZZ0214-1 TaxID=1077348 RepID=A0A2G8S560_9APHY|nr:hypothetical protein GSI_08937 [Ganoderma sinense ZZ0214-1]